MYWEKQQHVHVHTLKYWIKQQHVHVHTLKYWIKQQHVHVHTLKYWIKQHVHVHTLKYWIKQHVHVHTLKYWIKQQHVHVTYIEVLDKTTTCTIHIPYCPYIDNNNNVHLYGAYSWKSILEAPAQLMWICS